MRLSRKNKDKRWIRSGKEMIFWMTMCRALTGYWRRERDVMEDMVVVEVVCLIGALCTAGEEALRH